MLALSEDILRIESVITHEAALCDWVERRLQALNPHHIVRASNSLSVLPRPLREGLPTLMLVGHLDTVPKLSENPVRREGDKLHGLGASDMKAADAVLLDVVERAIVREPAFNVIGLLYSCEEGPFKQSEMPLIYEAARAHFDATDLAICMEPTDGRIELGCLGTCHATVSFAGKRAHSARPWQGENAIQKAAGLLQRLEDFGRRRFEFHGLEFSEVCSATMIEYRGARNVVPDLCEVNVNYRFAPGKDEAAVRAELAALIGDDGEWELDDFCPAGQVCGDNVLLAQLRQAAGDPEVTAKQAWTDVGRLSNLGIDAINWGPGATSQAHQAGEWVSMAAVVESAEILDRWLFA